VDQSARYRDLAKLARPQFLLAAAPAALLRDHGGSDGSSEEKTLTLANDNIRAPSASGAFERSPFDRAPMYPLEKKVGASFPDMLTIGRTPNNDIALAEPSVSRLHCYFKSSPADHGANQAGFLVADAGSKNGTWLNQVRLTARREVPINNGDLLKVGDVCLYFYHADALYELLRGFS
jgi:hypothetical protein